MIEFTLRVSEASRVFKGMSVKPKRMGQMGNFVTRSTVWRLCSKCLTHVLGCQKGATTAQNGPQLQAVWAASLRK